jgi:hypothetical protein
MNRREKTMAAVVGAALLLFGCAYGIQTLFIAPMKELDKEIVSKREALKKLKDERNVYTLSEDYLRGLAPRSFGKDADAATAQAGKMLTEQIVSLGLQESQFSRQPAMPKRFHGAQEIGWSVQGEGPMDKMLDLLFVLEQAPQVHRIENLVLSTGEQPGRLKARFRYLTLVIENPPEGGKADLKPKYALDSPQRRFYDCISQRDLLRAYVPKPVSETAARASSADNLKVVALSQWRGAAEASICDTAHNAISVYRVGDTLDGALVAMIDYRTLPAPGKSGLLSSSRLILKIGSDYWAVEVGQTLATKYQMSAGQLPAELRGL